MPEWFQLLFVVFFSLSQYDTKKSWIYKWSFSITFFERYVNSKSDNLELLLSVYATCFHWSVETGIAYKQDSALILNGHIHTVQPNRTLYRIHHISDTQRGGLLRIKCVIYGTPFQHIFNYLKISSIIWRYILYLQIFEDIFNSYEFIFK